MTLRDLRQHLVSWLQKEARERHLLAERAEAKATATSFHRIPPNAKPRASS